MNTKKNLLSNTDSIAIDLYDSNYINNKGAKLYRPESYAESVEYYRLAAAMGNVQSISNLGYCYLYGRGIEADLSLAVAYFKLAVKRNNVDAAYKLGDIYGSDKWGIKDKEMSIYYYRMAASFVIDEEWESEFAISYKRELQSYPSLCYALGRELSTEGDMYTDLDRAYQFLKHAEAGYKRELNNGNVMYQKSYEGVLSLLNSEQFSEIKDKYDKLFQELEDDYHF